MKKEDSFHASNDDLLGGIKAAIYRGETLKQAMITLFNAGYSKSEIEEAARKYMMGKTEEAILTSPSEKKDRSKREDKSKKKKEEKQKIIPKNDDENKGDISRSSGEKPGVIKKEFKEQIREEVKEKQEEKKKEKKPLFGGQKASFINEKEGEKENKQKISAYDSVKKKKRKIEPITIILILLLVLLVGVLIGVFMFKEEVVEFFNKLFG